MTHRVRKTTMALRRAYSLIELVVVVGLLTTLLALSLPAIASARAAARKLSCSNNLHQLAIAMQLHHDVRNALPPSTDDFHGKRRAQGWAAKLLPFLEQHLRFSQIEAAYEESNDPFDGKLHPNLSSVVATLSCPEDSRTSETGFATFNGLNVGTSAFLGNSGTSSENEDGVLYYRSKIRFSQIKDGTSNTLLIGERPPSYSLDYGWWYAGQGISGGALDHHLGTRETRRSRWGPCTKSSLKFQFGSLEDECSVSHFWSHHVGGAHFATVDSAVRFFSYDSADILHIMSTRDGGEITGNIE